MVSSTQLTLWFDSPCGLFCCIIGKEQIQYKTSYITSSGQSKLSIKEGGLPQPHPKPSFILNYNTDRRTGVLGFSLRPTPMLCGSVQLLSINLCFACYFCAVCPILEYSQLRGAQTTWMVTIWEFLFLQVFNTYYCQNLNFLLLWWLWKDRKNILKYHLLNVYCVTRIGLSAFVSPSFNLTTIITSRYDYLPEVN
jgi:hypothetical protein